jgi:hypothetical protein
MACCEGEGKYYVGDVGTKVIIDVCVDITTATIRQIKVKKPVSGSTVIWSGGLEETTKISYFVRPGDFDEEGWYYVQAYVEMPGWTGHGETAKFRVTPRFQ